MSEETTKQEGETKDGAPAKGDILAVLIDLANSEKYKDYKCFSVSGMTKFEDKDKVAPGEMAALSRELLKAYILSGRGDKETFIKAHVNSGLVFIQAHEKLPMMAQDGIYDTFTCGFKHIKTCAIKGVIVAEPDKFEPFVLIRGDKEDDFSIIKGDPFPNEITKDTIDAVNKIVHGEE